MRRSFGRLWIVRETKKIPQLGDWRKSEMQTEGISDTIHLMSGCTDWESIVSSSVFNSNHCHHMKNTFLYIFNPSFISRKKSNRWVEFFFLIKLVFSLLWGIRSHFTSVRLCWIRLLILVYTSQKTVEVSSVVRPVLWLMELWSSVCTRSRGQSDSNAYTEVKLHLPAYQICEVLQQRGDISLFWAELEQSTPALHSMLVQDFNHHHKHKSELMLSFTFHSVK